MSLENKDRTLLKSGVSVTIISSELTIKGNTYVDCLIDGHVQRVNTASFAPKDKPE